MKLVSNSTGRQWSVGALLVTVFGVLGSACGSGTSADAGTTGSPSTGAAAPISSATTAASPPALPVLTRPVKAWYGSISHGTLRSFNGCLGIEARGKRGIVIWPEGSRLSPDGSAVTSTSGSVLGRVGHTILLAGPAVPLSQIESHVSHSACVGGPTSLVYLSN